MYGTTRSSVLGLRVLLVRARCSRVVAVPVCVSPLCMHARSSCDALVQCGRGLVFSIHAHIPPHVPGRELETRRSGTDRTNRVRGIWSVVIHQFPGGVLSIFRATACSFRDKGHLFRSSPFVLVVVFVCAKDVTGGTHWPGVHIVCRLPSAFLVVCLF